ncbi:hypothetical protein C8J57DRAFT_1356988 [Mycena rebaudengoi]|nr:hypothetical protein C8J57DRAFT_1356988 [Mycena rebaudengoi]
MYPEITVVCAVAGHPDFLPKLNFPSDGYSYTGHRLMANIQDCHDAQCSCATRIHNAWTVELKASELGPVFTKIEMGDDLDERIQLLSPLDIMWERIPSQPEEDIVSIVCDALLSESPTSSSFSSSTASKRSRRSSNEESISDTEDGGPDRKRANTSPSSLVIPEDFNASEIHHEFPRMAFVDKTRAILPLSDKYRHILIRPPLFGKTVFVSTLMYFYDLHAKHRFTELFGSLAVATMSTPSSMPTPNQHLCIRFELSGLRVLAGLPRMASSLQDYVSSVVESFLYKYAIELELSDPVGFVGDEDPELLTKLFSLVKARGQTLFVAVEEYEAPSSDRFFAELEYSGLEEKFATHEEIERLLDAPPLDNLHNLGLTPLSTSYPSCGFTGPETLEFTRSAVGDVRHAAGLGRSCGEYLFFPEGSGGESGEPVLHPQRVIAELAASSLQNIPHGDLHSFALFCRGLSLLPKSSDVSGAVTTRGLIDLLAAGAVEVDDHMDAPFNVGNYTLTWSILYYLGALTHDRRLNGALRIASSAVLSMIHHRVDQILADKYKLSATLFRAFRRYSRAADPEPFLDVLSNVLRDQVKSSYGKRFEPDGRGIFELTASLEFASRTPSTMSSAHGSSGR